MHRQESGMSFLIDWKAMRSSSTEEGHDAKKSFADFSTAVQEVLGGSKRGASTPKRVDQDADAREMVETIRA